MATKNKKKEEVIDVEKVLDKEHAILVKKANRNTLIGYLVATTLRNDVQDETINKLEEKANHKQRIFEQQIENLESKLHLAQNYNAKKKKMLESVMESWDEYHV